MALFDFPRIHFGGDINVNVATINNTYYFPITIYDATRSRAFMPPRLYFSSYDIWKAVKAPINTTPKQDCVNKLWYIEIEPINTIELLRQWCMTPLGSDSNGPDAGYAPYYAAADNDSLTGGTPIVGNCPGYWNMYGDMSVSMNNVYVTSIQTLDGSTINTWTNESANTPADIKPFLNVCVNTNTTPTSGISTAVMVETVSSQSVNDYIFCSNFNLFNNSNPDEIFLQGTPYRFQGLIFAAWRVVNWMPPMAGSGRFCTSIPMENIMEADQSELLTLFNNNKAYDSRQLKGVFVTFTIFEVFENRYDQTYYAKNGTTPNPGRASTIGSITPWYDGDMICSVPGRNLISLGQQPIYTNQNSIPNDPTNPSKGYASVPINFTPVTVALTTLTNGNAVFSVDMGNSWPEVISPTYAPLPPTFLPAMPADASFETANIGTLIFQCNDANVTQIASISIDPAVNPRSTVYKTGGIFDFVITNQTTIQTIQNNFINGILVNGSTKNQVLKESLYMICTDTKGLYAEQGDNPVDGYYAFDHTTRTQCVLRIFQKGVPVTTPVNIGVAEYVVPEAANDPSSPNPPPTDWSQSIADNQVINLASGQLQLNNNAIYYFVYRSQYSGDAVPPFSNPGYTIMDTGSFAVLRVHPKVDYSMYIDPSNPNYTAATFDIVYKEIFQMYDIAYPAMALIHPFTADQWNTATMSDLTLQRCDPSIWSNILYMSRSREISACQLDLLKAWNKYLNSQQNA